MASPATASDPVSSAGTLPPSEPYVSLFGPGIPREYSPKALGSPSKDTPPPGHRNFDTFCHEPEHVQNRSPTGPPIYARISSCRTRQADHLAENLGPTPQPLRAFSGFAGQQAPQNRNPPLGSARLQNSKLGTFGC